MKKEKNFQISKHFSYPVRYIIERTREERLVNSQENEDDEPDDDENIVEINAVSCTF